MLAFADFDNPFLLETDMSKSGLEVVLLQKQPDGQYHPAAYMSQSLTAHEYNYHSTKQEFLALKWAISEQFQECLCWKPFVVKTDNNPLTYILTTPTLDATWHCWVELLAGFMFSIKNRKGKTMLLQCSDPYYIKAVCTSCEVYPRWSHHRVHRKG